LPKSLGRGNNSGHGKEEGPSQKAWARVLRSHNQTVRRGRALPCSLELAAGIIGGFGQTHERGHDPGVVLIGLGIEEESVGHE
jgi:hypothetical protein